MTSFNEGTTKYRVAALPLSRQFKVTSETFIDGKSLQFQHRLNDVGQGIDEALGEGVNILRPKIARAEAAARGVDVAVPADPAIDRAIAAKAERDRKHAELLAEIQAEQEAAGRQLNEQNPLWGSF